MKVASVTANRMIRLTLCVLALFISINTTEGQSGYFREVCTYRKSQVVQAISIFRRRLYAAREQMQIRSSLEGPVIDAYILPSCDEHLNEEVAVSDQRLLYLTGFSGVNAFAAITLKKAAIWVEDRYLRQADAIIDCDWEIYRINGSASITDWLGSKLRAHQRVGADPRLVSHYLWTRWNAELRGKFLKLSKIMINLIDLIWDSDRPRISPMLMQVHELTYAGERWEAKVAELRRHLKHHSCDAIILTSLTEIAFLLNVRGKDIPYTPVVNSYLIVSHEDIFFYVDHRKIDLNIDFHLHTDCFNEKCVKIKPYEKVWNDIMTLSQKWRRVLVPGPCEQEPGASEAVFTTFPERIIFEHVSPVIFMRAQKNSEEQKGMQLAHIRDGAAICEAMSNLEVRFSTEPWTEEKVKYEIERSRLSQNHSKGLSMRTVVAFGEHSALPYYISSNVTDIEVTDQNPLVVESGGQYLEGTTDISRTYIFGSPTLEMKQAYTNVLAGILRLSRLKFPSHTRPSNVDALVRSPIWDSMSDYPKATGHGVGSYGAVREPPISVTYGTNSSYGFKEGYFFSAESGFYKQESFGVRLKNVFQVIDIQNTSPEGSKFLAFQDVTLSPYEPKLIDGSLLSAMEKRWLNEYNAQIRQYVGEELKKQGNMQAFHWMMNKTRHIREYLPEEEYRAAMAAATRTKSFFILTVPAILLPFLAAFLDYFFKLINIGPSLISVN